MKGWLVCWVVVVFTARGGEEHLRSLTDSTFEEYVRQHPELAVLFYSSSCPYSKEFLQELNSYPHYLTSRKSSVVFARLDAIINPITADKYGIDKFPMLKLFLNGTIFDYIGERDALTLSIWLTWKTKDYVAVVQNYPDLFSALPMQETFVVLFTGNSPGPELAVFAAVAKRSKHHIFARADTGSLYHTHNITSTPAVLMIKPKDKINLIYYGPWRESRLEAWVERHWQPWFSYFNDRVVAEIYGERQSRLIIVVDARRVYRLEDELRELAAEMKDVIKISTTYDSNDDELAATYFGIQVGMLPVAVIVQWVGEVLLKYRLADGLITKDSLKSFIDRWQSGFITPYFKSARPPDPDPDSLVKVIVGRTLDDVLSVSGRDVLVLFYVPKCLRCERFLRIFESLAQDYKENKKILFAKFDSSVNDVKDWTPLVFPAVRLYRRNRAPLLYPGEFTEDRFLAFIESYVLVK